MAMSIPTTWSEKVNRVNIKHFHACPYCGRLVNFEGDECCKTEEEP